MGKWKPVKGYEGFYEVSNFGQVKGIERIETRRNGIPYHVKESLLYQYKGKEGYFRVRLRKPGNTKTLLVHRLVAVAFVDNPNGFLEINHKDECKTNNKAENLEWCSRKYNINYGTGRERQAEKQSKKVYQYSLDGKLLKEWKSTKECKRNGHDQWAIVNCCQGKSKTHHGYKWSYEPL